MSFEGNVSGERPEARLFAMYVITGLFAAVAGGAACDGSHRGPTPPTAPTTPGGPPYTISGVISEYRGGPLADVGVGAYAFPPSNARTTTDTDQQGHYSLSSPGAEPTYLAVGKKGYQTAWKVRVSQDSTAKIFQDLTANFILHPSVIVNSGGDTLAGTIFGDEFLAGDDTLFGGLCVHTACKVIEFTEFVGAPRPFELRLRWRDPTRALALYEFRGDPDGIPSLFVQPAARYCCSSESEVIATVNVSGYYEAVAVAFEHTGGARPSPSDSEPFELTIRPVR